MQLWYSGTVLPNLRYFLNNLKLLNTVRFRITPEKVNKVCKYTFVTNEVKVWISKLRCSQNANETKIDNQMYVDYTNFEVLNQCVVIKFSNVNHFIVYRVHVTKTSTSTSDDVGFDQEIKIGSAQLPFVGRLLVVSICNDVVYCFLSEDVLLSCVGQYVIFHKEYIACLINLMSKLNFF